MSDKSESAACNAEGSINPDVLSSKLAILGELRTRLNEVLLNAKLQQDETSPSFLGAVTAFVKAIESNDKDTGAHIERMGHYSVLLYEKYGREQFSSESLRLAAMLHDIGKICTPYSILKKPGQLNSDEWKIMQEHAEHGYLILRDTRSPLLQLGALIARSHHEKWDGSGYPYGLQGTGIPLVGRVVALADVFDALLSRRCYKEAWPLERALEAIKQGKGRHFDPDLVDIFFAHLDEFLLVRGRVDRSN